MLFAVNTPDNKLEVFHLIGGSNLVHLESIPVGLEPVALAVRSEHEVWVTNLISDSVSVVKIFPNGEKSRVERTLLVGDEPRDIVFAGPGGNRAFVTTAHRGQNVPYDPQLTTPGVGRADVWVFDASHLGSSLGGTPLTIVSLFTDTPRALAVSNDGSRVYAAGFHTGNQTTVASSLLFIPLTLPLPVVNFQGLSQPPVSLIVKFDGAHWVDELTRPFDSSVMFNLPDKDVFVIDANASPPAILAGAAGRYTGVGTVLYNMAVNPVSGAIYVSNTEALNQNRFEGPGDFAGHTVRGDHNRHRITVLGLDGSVRPRHLNKHIDFSSCCAPVPNAESEKSLALPMQLVVSPSGGTLYVAAMGSSKIGVYATAALENDTFVPSASNQIAVSGGGPTGLVLDSTRNQMYVLTRFDNSISIIDTNTHTEVAHVAMHNPEPASIVEGRRFLYDATLSAHGDSQCASCHVFGDNDSLGWDLGNPDETYQTNDNPIIANVFPFPIDPAFAPMKGPMTTQSLRGMANHGPMHWRGDRTGSPFEPNAEPDSGAFNEREAFRQFQAGFVGLLGRSGELSSEDMDAFTDFILQLRYPPNPVRNLDDTLTAQQQEGRTFFFEAPSTPSDQGILTCEQCHRLDPDANAQFGVDFPGFFGSSAQSSREPTNQVFKVPHLRNLYTKVGMFGMPPSPVVEELAGMSGFQGDQVRGFGAVHSGEFDTPARFLSNFSFSQAFPFGPNPGGFPEGEAGTPLRRSVEAFLFAFDSNLKPIVGQQITLSQSNATAVAARIDLLLARADAGDCDLVAKGSLDHLAQGYLYLGTATFRSDKSSTGTISAPALRAAVDKPFEFLTFTCTPPGSGMQIGIDRDLDGILDRDDPTLD